VFGAVTVLPALLAVAWLLPGLPLILAGRFTVLPMVFISVPLAVGLCYFTLRHLPVSWPGQPRQASGPERAGEPQRAGAARRAVPWWAVAATVGVAVVFAGWQIWMRTQQIIYQRDPATYLQVGYWIAHHGSLPIPQSLAAFGGSHPGLSFASVNYYPRGTGIVPQFMTGFPAVVAGAVWAGGIPAALVLTPLIGGCAILSFGGLAGRLIGPRWAPAAAAILALSLPEIYTSRSTFSEPLAQVLLFGGLSLLADDLLAGIRLPRGNGRPAVHRWVAGVPPFVKPGIAGLTLGLSVFVRLDALSDILPVIPFLGLLLAARRRQAIPFGLGLLVGAGYGLLDGYRLSRPYLDLEAPSLHPLALITAAIVLLTVAGVAVAVNPGLRRWVTPGVTKGVTPGVTKGVTPIMQGGTESRLSGLTTIARRWLPEAAAVLTLLVFVAFAIRPLVQTVAGETIPSSIAYVAELQKLAHLPIDGRQQYYQDSLYWVIWYTGVPTVLLGAIGLATLARQGLRALLTWHDPDGTARIWTLPLMMALWVIVTVLWRPAVSPDQPWASRRLVPFVLPGLILGAIWVSAWLKIRATQLGTRRLTSAAAVTCCVAALVIPTAWTTFGVSLSPRPTAHGMAFKRIGRGELTAVRRLCAAIGPDASVVILDQLTADRFAQVTRGICDTPTAVLANPSTPTLAAVVSGIQQAGRRPVLLAQSEAPLAPYGGTPREVVDLLTTQEAHLLTTPPARTWGIHYTVWMSQPPRIG
jgi:hypothetical protein